MNKKIVIVISTVLVLYLIGGLFLTFGNLNKKENSSDNNNDQGQSLNKDGENQNKNDDKTKDSKSIVIYFSQTGTTKKIAEYISDINDSEIVEIIPMKEYTNKDLNYNDNNSRANKEQNDKNARPEIKNDIDITDYDTIYLGYPIWWGDAPKIILTFLDTHDLNGKTVVPFCTSHSSGISGSINTLKNYNDKINWIEGKRFSSSSSKNEVEEWLDSLD